VKLSFERVLPAPIERLFAFHCDPENLVRLLAGWPTFRMVAHQGNVRPGSLTRVRERLGIVWVPMTFLHFVYEPPGRFGERLVRGPFRKFEHVHEFESIAGGTRIRDRLDVELPWWLGGELGMRLLVGPKLRRFFAYRHAELDRLVRAGAIG
jgi:hypothetical protein